MKNEQPTPPAETGESSNKPKITLETFMIFFPILGLIITATISLISANISYSSFELSNSKSVRDSINADYQIEANRGYLQQIKYRIAKDPLTKGNNLDFIFVNKGNRPVTVINMESIMYFNTGFNPKTDTAVVSKISTNVRVSPQDSIGLRFPLIQDANLYRGLILVHILSYKDIPTQRSYADTNYIQINDKEYQNVFNQDYLRPYIDFVLRRVSLSPFASGLFEVFPQKVVHLIQ